MVGDVLQTHVLVNWEDVLSSAHQGGGFPLVQFGLLQLLLFDLIGKWGLGLFELIFIFFLFPLSFL